MLFVQRAVTEICPMGTIGTNSLRRQVQLSTVFPATTMLRERRPRLKADAGEFDGIILRGGLKRLGYESRIANLDDAHHDLLLARALWVSSAAQATTSQKRKLEVLDCRPTHRGNCRWTPGPLGGSCRMRLPASLNSSATGDAPVWLPASWNTLSTRARQGADNPQDLRLSWSQIALMGLERFSPRSPNRR
jgi:porphobilinogen deaminase